MRLTRVLTVLGLLLLALCAEARPYVRQIPAGTTNDASSTTITFSYSNVTAGDTLVGCTAWANGAGITASVADSVNGAWTSMRKQTLASGTDHLEVFYFLNSAAGSPTVTVTYSSAATFRRVAGLAVAGIKTTSAEDGENSGSGNSTDPASGAFSTAATNSFIFGCVSNNGAAPTADSPLIRRTLLGSDFAIGSNVRASASSASVDWSQSPGNSWGAIGIGLLWDTTTYGGWESLGTLGSNQSATDNLASLAITTSAAAEAGNLAVLCVAVDNNGTGDGDEGAVSSITDSNGTNTWTKLVEFANGQGAAVAGAVASLWYSVIAGQINSSGTITANFSNSASRDAAALTAWEFSFDPGATVSVEGTPATLANDGADPGAITLSSLGAGGHYLWLHCLAGEGPTTDAYTWDSDYTQFSANGTTGTPAAGNMHVRGGWRQFTATSDTVDVTSTTADRDYAQVLGALKLTGPGTGPPTGGLLLLGAGS
jgi:hypothetical protein